MLCMNFCLASRDFFFVRFFGFLVVFAVVDVVIVVVAFSVVVNLETCNTKVYKVKEKNAYHI